MGALPTFPPLRVDRDASPTVKRLDAQARQSLLTDTALELKAAVENGWYVHGHAVAPEPAAEAIDAFSVGVKRLDDIKQAAIREALAGRPAGTLFGAFVLNATVHAAEQLVDMMNDGMRITFGPKQ